MRFGSDRRIARVIRRGEDRPVHAFQGIGFLYRWPLLQGAQHRHEAGVLRQLRRGQGIAMRIQLRPADTGSNIKITNGGLRAQHVRALVARNFRLQQRAVFSHPAMQSRAQGRDGAVRGDIAL